MKARFGITIFSNGEMDILKGSMQEDLWRDYRFFLKKAAAHRTKKSRKSILLTRRYERAAVLALFAFFQSVVKAWSAQCSDVEPDENIFMQNQCRQLLRHCGDAGYNEKQFSHFFSLLARYERNQQVFLETINGDSLEDLRCSMNAYLDYLESHTKLRRFPAAGNATQHVMQQLMDGL